MNEVIIQTHTGDSLRSLLDTAMQIVKIKTVSYVVMTFNGCKLFIKKDSDISSIMKDYKCKLELQ
jgi:hypothetical protein